MLYPVSKTQIVSVVDLVLRVGVVADFTRGAGYPSIANLTLVFWFKFEVVCGV